jgi:UDP-N-acetylglucosamine--N-acetylmuramyl-(pentapeptide) pyrophosphoryl-undecaprenol N-acetylglucosamine transferase
VVGFFAKRVFLGFAGAARFFPRTPTEFVGQWIDPIFTEYIASHPFARKADGYSTRIVVQCGGLGSTMIFEQLLACVAKFPNVHFTVALGTLNEHFFERFARYPNVYVKKWFFHEELAGAYADADIAIVRAAATTLAECELFGLRIVMVPLGISSFDHQYHNAVEYRKINPGHVLLTESELADLEKVIESLKDFRKVSYGGDTEVSAMERVLPTLLSAPTHPNP